MKFRLRKPIPWFKIMKITFSQILIAIVLSSIAYSSPLKAQAVLDKTVTLSLNNTTLLNVLNYLQKHNNVKFIYSKDAIDVSQTVSANFQGQPLKAVLDQLFKDNGIGYEVLNDRILLGKAKNSHALSGSPSVTPDNKQAGITAVAAVPITGKVIDEKGEPIIGATVAEKGTTNGVLTDVNGNFKLTVSGPTAILSVGYIGYKTTEVTVGNQTTITITLAEDMKSLNEVVVVGYGTQRKSVTTGAISSVTARDFEDQPVTRLEGALQGRVTGLTVTTNNGQPGSASTVRVRGLTTFNDNNPLYVIDGVVVDNGGIGFLNESDIESVEVLKDAVSASIYGTRAATGVILVTTKKGKAGRTQINYSGYYGISGPARKLDLLNATQYATLINEATVAGGGNPVYANPAALGTGTDWQSLIFNNSAREQSHNLSVGGGTDKSTYYTSFGYLDQEGIVATPISHYTRVNFRVNETFKPAKWLNFGENIGYSYEKNIGLGNTNSVFGGPLSSAINLDPITPAVQTDPILASGAPYAGNPVARNPQGFPYGISTPVGQEITNPLAYTQFHLGNYNWAHNVVGNAFVEVNPLKGLALKSSVGTKVAFYGNETFTPLFYLNSSTNNLLTTNYNRGMNRIFNWNLENTASYTRSFGKHNLNVLLGQGAYVDNNITSVGTTNYGLPVNSFNDASLNYNLPAAQRLGYGSEIQEHHVSSLFARLNYDYNETYILQAIVRRDGSSRFGSNNKYGNFPSFSLGWVPTKESFWPTNNVVDFLKFRGGYGVTGNDNLNDNAFLSTIGGGRNYSFGTGDTFLTGNSPNAPSNPNLKWEQTAQTNIGLDMVLFNDFNLSLDWYKKKTTGILQVVNIPGYVGAVAPPYANVGDMENTGQEIQLGYHKKIGDFKIGFDGNLSHNKNLVTRLAPGQAFLGLATFQSISGNITQSVVGQPYGSFYGYQTLGIFQTQADVDNYISPTTGQKIQPYAKPGDFKFADLNGDGTITGSDRTYLGSSFPKWTYGLTFTAAYKNFDILIFGQGQGGNKIFQGLRRLDINSANYQTAALGRWTGPGTSNTYPRLTTSDINNNFTNNSNFYLQDGTFFRLRTIQLGYTFNKNILNKIGLQRVRIYVTGQNLVTFTKYTGYDPDLAGSIDQGVYPQARTFILGLSAGF